jgi:hypothetical protein
MRNKFYIMCIPLNPFEIVCIWDETYIFWSFRIKLFNWENKLKSLNRIRNLIIQKEKNRFMIASDGIYRSVTFQSPVLPKYCLHLQFIIYSITSKILRMW